MHLPFAYELMRELKPRTFVELGVYRGESYFAFCQSVEENRLKTQCFGIDTWRGDIHAGLYGPEIGQEVAEHNVRYSRFSRLLQMTFDEALERFAPRSIDLLHIDGAHRYEDVKHDFEAWQPRLSRTAVVLFHDVTEHSGDFGVHRLWSEIAKPRRSFLFDYGHGLGVWKRAAVSDADPDLVKRLFGSDKDEAARIRAEYALKAAAVRLIAEQSGELSRTRDAPTARIFAPHDALVEESYTSAARVKISQWQRLSVELPWGVGDGSQPLRFDPVDRAGVVELAGFTIRSSATGEIVWSARKPRDLQQIGVRGTCVRVPHPRTLRLLCYADDPQIELSALDTQLSGEPLLFQVWIRFDPATKAMKAAAEELDKTARALEVASSRLSQFEANDSTAAAAKLVVYAAGSDGYDEQAKLELTYRPDRWAHLHIALEHGLGREALRVDPLDSPGLIDIAGVAINSAVTGDALWEAHNGNEQMAQLRVSGSAVQVPHGRLVRILSYGNDPQLLLPALSAPEYSGPLRLELWLRSSVDAATVGDALHSLIHSADRLPGDTPLALASTERGSTTGASQEAERLRGEWAKAAEERHNNAEALAALRGVEADLRAETDRLREEVAELRHERDVASQRAETSEQTANEHRAKVDQLENTVADLQRTLASANMTIETDQAAAENARAERARLQAKLDTAAAEVIAATHELTKTRAEIARLKDQLNEQAERLAKAEYDWWGGLVRSVRRWAGTDDPTNTPTAITAAAPRPYDHWIDRPTTASRAGEDIVISGWVIDADGDLIQRVRARIGELIFNGTHGYERTDVGESYPARPDAKYSGFEIRARLGTGRHRVELQRISANADWQTFATFEHEVLPAARS